MDLSNPEADTPGGLIIRGNATFNGPVLVRSNYYSKGPEEAFKCHQPSQEVDHVLDLMVMPTTEYCYSQHIKEKDIYQIKSNPKGKALIINNEFKNKRNERKGSSIDLMKMMQLWEQIGCSVEIQKNLTGSEIRKTVKRFVNSDEVSNIDFCVVIVMSHGSEGDLIVGEKETKTSVTEIVNTMTESKALLGKPKLLFFQMCRGMKAEKEHRIDADGFDTADSTWFLGMLQELLPQGERLEADSTQIDATAEEHIGGSGDMMIAFATQPDHVSFRGQDGSWFISAVTKVFAEQAKNTYLKELMRMVKDEVKKNTSYMPSNPLYDQCTATVEASDTFRGKKLFLFPGFPENF